MSLPPDCKSIIINGKSGYKRDNSNWVIGRIIQDFDYWSHIDTKERTDAILDAKWAYLRAKDPEVPKPVVAGLVVSIYRPSDELNAMVPVRDKLYWSGCVTAMIQLGISAIPCGLTGDWGVLLITGVGITLAFITGSLPQWRKEKWGGCRSNASGTFILTKGNGAQHAIVVLASDDRGLNLEDLAAGQININLSPSILTRGIMFCLMALWILLLVTAAGLEKNSWYLLAVGGIGMVQNLLVAGSPRRPENFGIPLSFERVFGEAKVMKTLFDVEDAYPRIGLSMLDEFFPGKLNADEVSRWAEFEARADNLDATRKRAVIIAKKEREQGMS